MPVTEKVHPDLKSRTHIDEFSNTIDYIANNSNEVVIDSLKSQRASKLQLLGGHRTTTKQSVQEKVNLNSFDGLSYNHSRYLTPKYSDSYLRSHSKFCGIQQSSKARYKIEVEFKHVDLYNSLVIGFLKINGLTDEYPEITTCFKGEIINNPLKTIIPDSIVQEYTFLTDTKSWGSSLSNDLDHWKRLTNHSSLTDDELIKKLDAITQNESDKGLVYMRWKEEFLLPDARIKQISGASFEGFYYIVLNIGNNSNPDFPIGSINGLYYYHTSEKFQSLSLASETSSGQTEAFQFL